MTQMPMRQWEEVCGDGWVVAGRENVDFDLKLPAMGSAT